MEINNLPTYKVVPEAENYQGTIYYVLTDSQLQIIPENQRQNFNKDGETTLKNGKNKIVYLTLAKASQKSITSDVTVKVSAATAQVSDYLGNITDFLASAYKFNRKEKQTAGHIVSVVKTTPKVHKVISLVEARVQTREWGNGRGDIQGTPQFFRAIAEKFAAEYGLKITVFSGNELLNQGFRLMHAVGRASKNQPVFVNLAYNGNPNSDQWSAFVGKGVCFDTGGYNIKPASSMLHMFLDKCGAVTCLSAFQAIVKQKIAINLTCSIGLVQNFISDNAYRPSDIIKSRKGLTVEIGDTDAQGRLVLADCMHWTQQNYKTKVLIQLSTLTGAIIVALGSQRAGVYTNDDKLYHQLSKLGDKVHDLVWHMPVSDYHKKIISPEHCDISNYPGRPQAGSGQAAAFLKCFVEEGTRWAHIDIAGTGMISGAATGWGTRLLIQYARQNSHKPQKDSKAEKIKKVQNIQQAQKIETSQKIQ